MKKRVFSLLLAVIMTVSILPLSAIHIFADETVNADKYIDRSWDSDKKQVVSTEEDIPDDAKEITAETRELAGGWYVLSESVTLPEGAHITVNGDAHLVLCDGCELKISATGSDHAAIELTDGSVLGSSDSLTIYGQKNGTGSIVAYSGSRAAGIGSNKDKNCGKITICGGIITATGGTYGAGIGGGEEGDCGDIIIYGGTVTAASGGSAAGLGNGSGGNGGSITVYGGKVTAYGNGGGMALGGGSLGTEKNDIYIYGGDILADSKTNNDAVIANSLTVYGNSHNVFTVKDSNGTELSFSPVAEEKEIYKGGTLAGNKILHIELQPVHTFEKYVNNGDDTHSCKCSVCGALYDAKNHDFTGDYVNNGDGTHSQGCTVCGELSTPEAHTFDENNDCVCGAHNWGKYIDRRWDEETGKVISEEKAIPADAKEITADTTELMDGWYVVSGTVTIDERIQVVNTDDTQTNIILLDGAILNVTAGMTVFDHRTLNIYGQKNDTGKIVANSTVNAAIGGDAGAGDFDGKCGTVTINGGTVTAISEGGAGIGGGEGIYSELDGIGGKGGTVTINGGIVTAISKGGAGIGGGAGVGGDGGDGGTVTVNGGTVTASSAKGVGIGAGRNSTNHGALTIADGMTVKAGDNADTAVTVTAENYISKRNPYVNIIGAVECAEYLYYDTESKEFKTGYCSDYEVIDKNNIPTTLEKDKWYLVKGTVEINDALTVPGNAHIILANDAVFTVSKGIAVKNGADLTFYAQTEDFDHMGKVLIKNTYDYNAAIGSVRQGECGDITINGGAFYVEGGLNAAGIGAGADGKCGTITVNGGKVFTISGKGGAGIGSGTAMDYGYENTCKAVVINGGVIGAVSQFCYGKHIGAGENSPAVTVTYADGVYKNDDLPHVLFINIEPFPETQPSCVDGHKNYFKNCVNGKYYTNEMLEPDSLIENIDEWLAGDGFTGEGDGNHKDTDEDGYCDGCGTLAKANINFYISHGDTPAFTLLCIADKKLMDQTDERANQAVYEKYGSTAGLVNYMYSNGNLVNENDLVPFGTESMDIYAVLAYDETQPTRTKNGHKAYFENTLDGCFYEDKLCTISIGDKDNLEEWLSTSIEDNGGMIPATGEPLDTPTADDFTFTPPASCIYDGQPKQATVMTDKDGMGKITVKYQKKNGGSWGTATTNKPTEIGEYRVIIAVDEGANYAASVGDIRSDNWKFEIFCQHNYIDYVCEFCRDEDFDEAQHDAIKAFDHVADHSDDEVIKLLAENAVNTLNEFKEEYNTVAEILKIWDLTQRQIDAIKEIIAAAGNNPSKAVKWLVDGAKEDICSAESVEEVTNIRVDCLADIRKLTGTTHTHTYSENWSCDPYYHWHDSTCDHIGLTSDFAAHTFGEGVVNGNVTEYTCSECGYKKYVYNTAGDNEGEIVTGLCYTGISLTLGSDISINFYMNLTDEARENGTMTFNIGGRIVTVKGTDAKYNEDVKQYFFRTPLTALEMNETITATFSYNGVEYIQEYSVAEYIEEIVGNAGKYGNEAALLAKKIANYGYYAQIYLESIHKNVTIGDGGYAAMFKCSDVDIDAAKAKEALSDYKFITSGTSDNLSRYGTTVYFDSATALNYYMTVKNGVKPTATALNTKTNKSKAVEITLYKDNIYIVSVKDITATELADDIEVKINNELTLTGSVFAYCNSVMAAHSFDGATEKDTYAVNAMAAFYEYYEAAMEYISFELYFKMPKNYRVFTADGEEITGDTTVKCYRTFSFRLVPDENYKIDRVISGWDIEPDENGLYTVSFAGGKHDVVISANLETVLLTVKVEGEDESQVWDTKISFVCDGEETIAAKCFGSGTYRLDIPKGLSGKIVITKSGYQKYSQEFTADGTVEEITVNLIPND